MKYRTLGASGIEVSTVCLGCWQFAPDMTWPDKADNDFTAAVDAAIDAGVTFFDTAEGYGKGISEHVLGRALGSRRKDVIVASKISDASGPADDIRRHCDASLTALGTDYLDLYQIHWPREAMAAQDAMAAMEALRDQGKIRAIGVSNFGVSYLNEIIAAGRVQTNQLCYNLLFRSVEYEIQPRCAANDIGLLCYSPLAQGLLAGTFASADEVPPGRARTRHFAKTREHARHDEDGCETATFEAIARIRDICSRLEAPMSQVALAWLLSQPSVVSVIAGARNAEQARQNAAAADMELDSETLAQLSAATEPVKQALGANADCWQSISRLER